MAFYILLENNPDLHMIVGSIELIFKSGKIGKKLAWISQKVAKMQENSQKTQKNSWKLHRYGQDIIKITKIIPQLEPLGKISYAFQRVCLKSRQNGQKCLKTATKVGKIGQKSHKMTKNQIETP